MANLFKTIRVSVLLYILILVAVGTWLSNFHVTRWQETLWVTVYPINGDGSQVAARYIRALQASSFQRIERFFSEQAKLYGVSLTQPVQVNLGSALSAPPPQPGRVRTGLSAIIYSLRLRYYAWRLRWKTDSDSQILLLVKYFDPKVHPRLSHSFGLPKGLVGVINVFADKRLQASNQIIIIHELLHTLGATDKYDPKTNLPLYPDGYAQPDRKPLLPQDKAEIMAGRIPKNKTRADIPRRMQDVIIGEITAKEINWLSD